MKLIVGIVAAVCLYFGVSALSHAAESVPVGRARVINQVTSTNLTVDLVKLSDGSKCVITRNPQTGTISTSCVFTNPSVFE